MKQQTISPELALDDADSLAERMISDPRGGAGPQEIRQVIAGEPLAGLEGETDEKGEVLARAEPHLLARCREQGGAAETVQLKGVSHRDHPVFLIRE
jgi:hypothetical protein